MLSLKDRVELLENDLKATPPGFVVNTDLPFAIFRYDPWHSDEGEWRMRREVKHLRVRVQNATGRKVHILRLSDLFWRSIEKSEGIEPLVELEKERGFEAAQDQVSIYLSDPDWRPLTELLAEATAEMDPDQEFVFLTRGGVFAPAAYRISSLLEQLMGKTMVPTVLFYPGSWSGTLNYMGLRSDEEPLGSYRVKIYGRES
ncbi:MAG: BREX protein BrxB domain-containing protein [Thermoplasmata archaeon]